jgi:toxin ParE1/3/4
MPRYILAPAAERDIEQILAWSHENFGERARLRYEALLVRAIEDIVDDADRAGSHARPEIAAEARKYHLHNSRDRVPRIPGRVSRPRHFLLYRTVLNGQVEIGRVLHDSVDLERHLPDEYRPRRHRMDDTI